MLPPPTATTTHIKTCLIQMVAVFYGSKSIVTF